MSEVKNLKYWLNWILEEFIPDYHTQVEYAKIGTNISLTELLEFEEFVREFLKGSHSPSNRNFTLKRRERKKEMKSSNPNQI